MKQVARILNASAYLTRFDAPTPANDAPEAATPTEIAEESRPDDSSLETLAPRAPEKKPTLQAINPEPAAVIDPTQLKAEFEANLDAARAEERARAAQMLEAARTEWTVHEGQKWAQKIDQTLEQGFSELRDEIARIMTPLITGKLKERVRETLIADTLKAAINHSCATIEIKGPADLIAGVSAAVAPLNVAIISNESEQVDACVRFDLTKIETVLSQTLSPLLDEGTEAGE